MAYDSAVVSFTTKTNKVDLADAAHINAVQTELVIIETILGTGLKGTAASLSARLNNALDSDGTILSGASFPSPAIGTSQQFWRTDLNTLYIWNGSQWTPQSGVTQYVAGSYFIGGLLKFVSAGSTGTYTKVLEMYVPRAGTLTIKYGVKANDATFDHYSRIYRNGVAVGTERNPYPSTTYTEYSEDISGWSAGDLIQIYAKDSGSAFIVGGLRLYENAPQQETYNPSTYPTALIWTGTGAPDGGIGSQGDIYMRLDGGASTTLYVKTGASTWTAK